MYISSSSLILALSALTATTNAALLPRQNGVSCQTSSGSPTNDDVTAVISQLKGQPGRNCHNTNGKGSDCTTLVKYASAGVAICGATTGNFMSCIDVANYASQIQQTCLEHGNDKVGGTYQVDAGTRVEIINSGRP